MWDIFIVLISLTLHSRGCEKSDISKHVLIHEEPKYVCEVCNKPFRHMKNKELHVKRLVEAYSQTCMKQRVNEQNDHWIQVASECQSIYYWTELLGSQNA